MSYRNPSLYNALKSYVFLAISIIVDSISVDSDSANPDEETFFFARLHAESELKELAEYKQCLEILNSDPALKREMDVLAGPPGGIRSRTPTANGLMRRVLDLGLPPGGSSFDPKYFEDQYADLEEAYYSSELAYQALAPLQGLLISASVQLADDLDISVLTTAELAPPNARGSTKLANDPWTEKLCAVRARYFLPKVVGQDKPVTPEDWEKDRAKKLEVNDRHKWKEVVGMDWAVFNKGKTDLERLGFIRYDSEATAWAGGDVGTNRITGYFTIFKNSLAEASVP